MSYERTVKNTRVLKSSAEVRPFEHRSVDAGKTQSADEATRAELSSERFSSESSTTYIQSPGLISCNNNQRQSSSNALSNSSVKSTSLEDNRTQLRSNENTVDYQKRSSPANINFVGWVYHGLQDLINLLQGEIKQYPKESEKQAWVLLDGHEGFLSSDLIEQKIRVKALWGIISKYRVLITNIESKLQLIASRIRESEEVSIRASEDVNSITEQKDAFIKNLLRKQMHDAELLNKAMKSLISKSGREFNEEVYLMDDAALISTKTNSSSRKNGIWGKINWLEKEIRLRNSDLIQLQTEYSNVHKALIDMMKYKQNVSPDKTLMKSSIERICDKADKLNKHVQTKLLRNLTHYVDCVDQQESSCGESSIFLLREKMKESRAQEVSSLEDERSLKTELAKLNGISQSIGVNTTDQLLLLYTIECVAETCDIIANCISALVKRNMNYQKRILQIQDNQSTFNQEEDLNTGGYSTISNFVTLQPKASISISSPVIYQTNLPIPVSVNANNTSSIGGNSDKYEEFLMSGCVQESYLPPKTNEIIDDQMPLVTSELDEMRISFLPSVDHVYNTQSPEASNKKFIRNSG